MMQDSQAILNFKNHKQDLEELNWQLLMTQCFNQVTQVIPSSAIRFLKPPLVIQDYLRIIVPQLVLHRIVEQL